MEITEFCTYLTLGIGITAMQMAMDMTILEVLDERRSKDKHFEKKRK